MRMILITLSTAISIGFVTWQALAQVDCQQTPWLCAQPTPSGSGGSGTSKPNVVHVFLKNRYGAVAHDPNTGVIGFVNEYKCRESAEKAALEQCGSNACKVTYFRNTCTTLVGGTNSLNKHTLYNQTASSQIMSDRLALSDCQADGSVQCKIITHGCSLPVQK